MTPDMQVWLDAETHGGQTIVVPYVRSATDRDMRYRLEVSRHGAGGTSHVSQGGSVHAAAEKPVALSRTSIAVRPDDTCTLKIVLSEKGAAIGIYRFDCPR